MEILTSLAGLNFRPASAKEAVDTLAIGDHVTLRREPSNQYDANAVQVHMDKPGQPQDLEFIGYIPKVDNAEIAEHMDEGGAYEAEVVSFLATRKPGFKVTLIKVEPDHAIEADAPDAQD